MVLQKIKSREHHGFNYYILIKNSANISTAGIVSTESNDDKPTSPAEYSDFRLYSSESIETVVAQGRQHTAVINNVISEGNPIRIIARQMIIGVIISFIAQR